MESQNREQDYGTSTFYVFAWWVISIIATIGITRSIIESNLYQRAIEQDCGQYVTNPKTGQTTFIFGQIKR